VVEALAEDLLLKQEFFKQLDRLLLAPARWPQIRNRLEILGDEEALLLSGPLNAPVLQRAGLSDANN